MPEPEKAYPAKLLLLGEHTVLKGSQALAAPLWNFKGAWRTGGVSEAPSLNPFAAYLERLTETAPFGLDAAAFAAAVRAGWRFESDIPTGYGAGSSGALVAAIWDAFRVGGALPLNELRLILGRMESFFHGSSSGLDPLISFVQAPVRISADGALKTVAVPGLLSDNFFLIDTGLPRRTQPWVELFLQKCVDPHYDARIAAEVNPCVDDAVEAFLTGQADLFFDAISQISFFQFRYFAEMIPATFRSLWMNGLASDAFKLKLCGGGGGGFILGYSADPEVKTALAKKGWNLITAQL